MKRACSLQTLSKMKTPFILLIGLILMTTTNCEKWDPAPDIDSNGLIARIENEEKETIACYEYNKNGTLKSSWEIYDYFYLGKKAEFTFEYNENNKLLKKTGYEPGNMIMSSMTGAMGKEVTLTFEYNANGKIVKKKVDYNYGEFPEINYSMNFSFEYPDEQIVVETTTNINNDPNRIAGKRVYQFNNKGNIETIISSYFDGETERTSTIEELTYDNKKAPVSFEPAPKSKNNITEKLIKACNYNENNVQTVAYTQLFKYEYTYNSNDYPEKIIETYPSTHFNTKHYFYKK